MSETIQQVEEAVREAVESGDDLYQQVRSITLKALTERNLDMENIKNVVNAVSQGISTGISSQSTAAKNTFKQSIEALDDALVKTAEASKLSIEEATSRVSEFSSTDLNQATEDIKNLEEMFLDTLSKVAQESNETFFDIAEDFIAHAKQSGTAVGKQAQAMLENINNFRHIGQEAISTSTATTTSTLAAIASGVLSGIADSLNPEKHDT